LVTCRTIRNQEETAIRQEIQPEARQSPAQWREALFNFGNYPIVAIPAIFLPSITAISN
jgi:hypothetical protein